MAVGGSFGEFAKFCKSEIRKIIKEECSKCDIENFSPYTYEQGSKCSECEFRKKINSYRGSMSEGGYIDIYNDEE